MSGAPEGALSREAGERDERVRGRQMAVSLPLRGRETAQAACSSGEGGSVDAGSTAASLSRRHLRICSRVIGPRR
jgi:hypothetical protein